MKAVLAVLPLLVVAAAVPATVPGREALGVWKTWGAFRDAAPARCFAIARPVAAGGRSTGFASVADWPKRGLRASLYIRLSRAHDRAAAVTLTIGERRFTLVAGGVEAWADAWAADAPSDRAIVAAMRSARSMSVEAVGARRRPFADVYALGGAATAIDAAALGCLRR